jgi:hypothetical protein
MMPDTTFNTNATFPANGNSQNQGTPSVLYIENGPAAAGCPAGAAGCKATTRTAGAGMFVAFAALNSSPNAFAFDETTGEPVWTASVAPGRDGIRGTPVIDPTARRVYIATGAPHQAHALSVDTGVEVTTGGWPATMTFVNSTDGDQNQHGALLLANSILYVPFGGQYGDGGNYLGWIFAIDTTNPANVKGWATQSARSGIWGSGGLASDGSSVFGVTGDTNSEGRNGSDSQEVVRITGMASFNRCAANVFVPAESPGWDRPAGDLDFGASTPAFVQLPAGSTPSALLVAPAKAGRLFILDASNLSNGTYDPIARTGSTNAPLADLIVSGTNGETVYTSPTIYTTSSGLHATINVGGGSNCPGGNIGNEVIVSTLIKPGQTPIASGEAWCSKVNAGGGHMNFPPISTTSDGVSADPLVWFIDGTQLRAVNGDTGASVLTTTGAACNGVPSMSFPIAVKNRIVVWAVGHLCSWSVNGN